MKVFVGLSGGVDSAVSAALLKERGFEVTGCFIKIWQPEFIECTWREDRLDAMRVAAALGIPFREIDLSEEYKKEVVEPMIAEYARGITPNPDVLCNKSIKFGHFARWAFAEGADRVATGHYARVCGPSGTFPRDMILRGRDFSAEKSLRFAPPRCKNPVEHAAGKCTCSLLLRGIDENKDQSYFLYRIERDVLARTLFPIGELKKSEVRAHAARFQLPVAQKPDSQGLCFVGAISMKEFLGRYVSLKPGRVLDMNGADIGTHDGAALYTRGERHGFRASGGIQYVVSVDIAANTIRVSPDRADACVRETMLTDVHWIHPVSLPAAYAAQVRYRATPVPVTVMEKEGRILVKFEEPSLVSPGQSIVLYEAQVCVGGGVAAEA